MREYIKQNGSGLYLDIQKIGCFFRAACHMAEMQAEKEGGRAILTVEEINRLWDYSKRLKYIDSNNCVTTSAPIANLAGDILKLTGKFAEVAIYKEGEVSWYGSVPKNQRHAEYFIQKMNQAGPSKTHFVNVDERDNLIWDPHDPEIINRGKIYTICYRYQEA